MVLSEGNMSLKIPLTPPGIDPGTVRLVAQRLNHYATLGSKQTAVSMINLSQHVEFSLELPEQFCLCGVSLSRIYVALSKATGKLSTASPTLIRCLNDSANPRV